MATPASYGSLPFAEQVEFFRRKVNVNTRAWTDVLGAQHDVSFMVAGANRDDIVADFREAVRKAIEDGATLQDFRKDFDRIVATHGWEYNGGRNWRSRVIYETNLRQSYNAGRWIQLDKLKSVLPYRRYRHSDAVQHPRPLHQSWDMLVLRADDPWLKTHWPANGWGCQCYIEGLSERDLARLGKRGPDLAPPPDVQQVTIGSRSPGGPRVIDTPAGVDPGFGYAPGRTRTASGRIPEGIADAIERTAQNALEKTARLPLQQAAQSASAMLARQRIAAVLDAGYGDWQAGVVAAQQARNSAYAVGAIEPVVAEAMTAAGVEPQTALIMARDAEVLHALRASKAARSARSGKAAALTAEELSHLPSLLQAPIAVLLDQADGALLYVVDASTRRQAGKIVVAVSYRRTTDAGTDIVNSIRTASVIDLGDVRADVRSGKLLLLKGRLE